MSLVSMCVFAKPVRILQYVNTRFQWMLVATVLGATCLAAAQSGLTLLPGLNTSSLNLKPTAAPDPTIAVGTLDYCEHVNNGYQCWYKSGANANQPVRFFGSTNPKTDSAPWSQNGNNVGNTPNCPTATSPNAQLLHDNVYNLWILNKRIHSSSNGHDYMCVAISNVEDVSQTTPVSFNWFGFEYDLDKVIPKNSLGHYYYPDYPQAGLWQSSTSTVPPYVAAKDQALWITYDLQDTDNNSNVGGALICAVDLAGLRASTYNPWVNNSKMPACKVAHSLVTYNQRRSWVPANNTDTTPPISGDGELFTYLIEPPQDNRSYLTDPNHTQGAEMWTIDFTQTTPVPTFVNSWDLPSTQAGGDQLGCFTALNYYNTVCVPQPSTATTGVHIDSIADRMQQFFHYTSNGGDQSVWTSAHTLQIVPSGNSLTQTEADIRILQFNTAIPRAIYVANDYAAKDPVDPLAWVFLPSVAMDKVGNLQGIFSVSGPGTSQHPGLDAVYFTPGSSAFLSAGYVASPSTDGDARGTDSLNYRWGDWSGAVLDPSDGCTVWVVGEYLSVDRTTTPNWYTEIAKLAPISTCVNSAVTLSSVSLNFGNQPVGVPSPAQVVTIHNNQSVALNISGISATGDFTQTNTCNAPVPAGGTCTVSVTFTPTVIGTRTGTLTVTDDAPNSPQTAVLTGVGIASSINITPITLSFGNQVINTTSAGQVVTITNNGASNLTVNSVAASGDYAETDTCKGQTLTPGQTCTLTVTLTPTVASSVTGEITIGDTAAGSPHLVALTGSGILAVTLGPSLTFAATNVGQTSPAQTMTLTNNQSSTLTFSYVSSGDYAAVGGSGKPCGTLLAANSNCTIAVTFSPTYNGTIKGAVTVNHNAGGGITSAGLSGSGQNGTAGPLTFSPATLAFANLALGLSSSKNVNIKNTGSTTLNLNSIKGSGNYAAVAGGSKPCASTLAAGATCSETVTYKPLVTGAETGGLTVSTNASVSPQIQTITGTGVLPVTLSPASISFGTQAVGTTSATKVVTVTNNESVAITISSVVATGQFVSTTGGSLPCGASVPANSICTLGVAFSPTQTGAFNGNLTFSYAASASPVVMNLSGTGQ